MHLINTPRKIAARNNMLACNSPHILLWMLEGGFKMNTSFVFSAQ